MISSWRSSRSKRPRSSSLPAAFSAAACVAEKARGVLAREGFRGCMRELGEKELVHQSIQEPQSAEFRESFRSTGLVLQYGSTSKGRSVSMTTRTAAPSVIRV